jgi:hypothetical protein
MGIAALFSSSESLAQLSGSPKAAQKGTTAKRADEIEKLHAWLRGLTGTFRVTVWPSQVPPSAICVRTRGYGPCIMEIPVNPINIPRISGIAICSAIGEGSGVSCLFDLVDSVGPFLPLPHVILYGVDPDKPGIRIQQFDAEGITTTALGDVKGDSAIFRNECPTRAVISVSCVQILRIRAPPNAKSIDMAIDQEKVMVSKPGRSQRPPTGQRIELKRER